MELLCIGLKYESPEGNMTPVERGKAVLNNMPIMGCL